MLRVDVLQNRWLILAVFGGIGVLLAVILFFIELWRPRAEQEMESGESFSGRQRLREWLRSFIPLLVMVEIIAAILFAVIYTLAAVRKPPNW